MNSRKLNIAFRDMSILLFFILLISYDASAQSSSFLQTLLTMKDSVHLATLKPGDAIYYSHRPLTDFKDFGAPYNYGSLKIRVDSTIKMESAVVVHFSNWVPLYPELADSTHFLNTYRFYKASDILEKQGKMARMRWGLWNHWGLRSAIAVRIDSTLSQNSENGTSHNLFSCIEGETNAFEFVTTFSAQIDSVAISLQGGGTCSDRYKMSVFQYAQFKKRDIYNYFESKLGLFVSSSSFGVIQNTDQLIYDDNSYEIKGLLFNGRAYGDTTMAAYAVSNEANPKPNQVSLLRAFPNPFNPSVSIHFDLPTAGLVRLTVHDLTGRTIATLDSGFRPSGTMRKTWNASGFSSGVYVLRLQSVSGVSIKKITLVK